MERDRSDRLVASARKLYSCGSRPPGLGADLFGYAIPRRGQRIFELPQCLAQLKEKEGYSQAQRDIWILGNTQIMKTQEARWSLLQTLMPSTKKN